MNIHEHPEGAREFAAALKKKDHARAIDILGRYGCTARPSQAPSLVEAYRKDPSIANAVVRTDGGGIRQLTAAVLFEDDHDETGATTATWRAGFVPLAERFPHYATDWRAEYQVRHYVAFGDIRGALTTIRSLGRSFLVDDFDGELFRALQTTNLNQIERDGNVIAFK